jgi:hypothetical protein
LLVAQVTQNDRNLQAHFCVLVFEDVNQLNFIDLAELDKCDRKFKMG